jgi:sugar phosphate permease
VAAGRRRRTVVLVALFAAYASFYLCRANVDAALPLLSRAYGYDKEELGRLASIGILAYAAGKISLGPIGDVIGGRRSIVLAITGSVLASFAFGASASLVALTLFAAVNRWFQAGGWVGVVHVCSREFAPEERGSNMGSISTSYEIGNVISLLLCAALVRSGLGWRALFVVNPILFGAIGFAAVRAIGFLARERRAADDVERAAPASSWFARVKWLSSVGSFWMALLLSFMLTFVRTGFLTWTPTFIAEITAHEGGTISGAILKSAVFPATGVAGALLAGRASDRLGPGRRAPLIAASLGLLVVSILVLAHAGFTSSTWVLLAIGASGLFLLGPYSLVGGAIALDVGATRAAATAAGLIDAIGYLGASLAGVLLGTMAQRHGWSAAFDILAVASSVAALAAAAWGFTSAASTHPKVVA